MKKRIVALLLAACMALGLCACGSQPDGFVKLDIDDIGEGAGLNSIDVFGDEALVLIYSYGEDIEKPYNLSLWNLKKNKRLCETDFALGGDYGCSAAFDEDGMIVVREWRGEGNEVTFAYDRELNKLENYVPNNKHPEDNYKALGITDFWQGDNYAYYDSLDTQARIFYAQPDRVFFTKTDYAYNAAEDGMKIAFCREEQGKANYEIADYSKGGVINRAELSTSREGYYDGYIGQAKMNEKYLITSVSNEERREEPESSEDESSVESSDESSDESSEESSDESIEESSESSEESSGSESASSEPESSSDESESSVEPSSSEESVPEEPESSDEPQSDPLDVEENDDGETESGEDLEDLGDGEETEDFGEGEEEDCDCGEDGDYYEDVVYLTTIWFWDYTFGASEEAEAANIYSLTLAEVEEKTKTRAAELSEKYGLTVVINPDYSISEGQDLIPNDTCVPAYMYLDLLDETLGEFPEGIFPEMLADGMFEEFRFCIGKSIDDDFSAAYSTNRDGILYIVMGTSSFSKSNIAHEMMHSMEYRMDNIWHQWNKLNPKGFEYYGDPREANNTDYDGNYFVRGYGQANQLEDRATIFEELFTSGVNKDLESWWYADKPGVVAKAKFLCAEIRKSYPSVAAVDEAVWERWLRGL